MPLRYGWLITIENKTTPTAIGRELFSNQEAMENRMRNLVERWGATFKVESLYYDDYAERPIEGGTNVR